MRKALTLTMIAIIVSSLCFVLNPASASSQTGVISTDTTWTKTESPYTITGQLTVNEGATLTVEAGATVNICGTLQVNGAIVAKGNSDSQITICGGNIILSPNNAGTKQGTTLEYCLMSSSTITAAGSVTISHCSTGTITITGGTSTVTNCSVTGYGYPYAIHIVAGSPTITYNALVGGVYGESTSKQSVISHNTVSGPVQIQGGTPVITYNSITGIFRGYSNNASNGTLQAGAGLELSGGIVLTGYNYGEEKLYNAVITDNTIVGGLDGICWNAGPGAVISNNLISNFTRRGLALGSNAAVCNNTIINNKIGIEIFNFNGDYTGNEDAQASPRINYNNILNSQYNIYSYCGRNLDASSNWWGTTDIEAIRETIYDHTFDQTLGTFNIIPVLMSENIFAYPSDLNTSTVNPPAPTAIPTVNSSQTPIPTPTLAPATNSSVTVQSNSTDSNLPPNVDTVEITQIAFSWLAVAAVAGLIALVSSLVAATVYFTRKSGSKLAP